MMVVWRRHGGAKPRFGRDEVPDYFWCSALAAQLERKVSRSARNSTTFVGLYCAHDSLFPVRLPALKTANPVYTSTTKFLSETLLRTHGSDGDLAC